MEFVMNLEMRSRISSDGRLKLWLEEVALASPAPHEVQVRMEAAPLNPSDILLLLGPADLDTLVMSGTADRPIVEARVPPSRLAAMKTRLDMPLPVGNEGAGTVIAAGAAVSDLLGRIVAIRPATGSYSHMQCVLASDCLVLPAGLTAMEDVASRKLSVYSRYGSPTHKQVYIYGVLDPSPCILDGQYGMAWGVGGWLMTWFYERLAPDVAGRLRQRAARDLTTIFASRFTCEIGLAEALYPEVIRRYARRATGDKFLIDPRRSAV
jgi:hypothetical protein